MNAERCQIISNCHSASVKSQLAALRKLRTRIYQMDNFTFAYFAIFNIGVFSVVARHIMGRLIASRELAL